MHKLVRDVRRLLKAQDFDFDFWVRHDGPDAVWCGPRYSALGQKRMLAMKSALEAAGLRCECNGKPGTVGEFIIEAKLNA